MRSKKFLVVEPKEKITRELEKINENLARYNHDIIVFEDAGCGVVVFKNQDIHSLIDVLEKALNADNELEAIIGDVKLKELSHNFCQPINQAIHYINRNIKDSPTLREVAEVVHLNPSYFSVLFREQTNITFSEFIMRKKIQEAKKLLLKTSLSVDEVAESIGYQSSKYFIKMFKTYEGVTPGKYRKEINLKGA